MSVMDVVCGMERRRKAERSQKEAEQKERERQSFAEGPLVRYREYREYRQ
jgi:hypothetical protein